MPIPESTGIHQEGSRVEDMKSFNELLGRTDEEAKENVSESSTEENQVEESPSQEGDIEETLEVIQDNTPDEDKDIPFHKHPRWKEVQEQNKRLEEQNKSFQDTVSSLTSKIEELTTGFSEIQKSQPAEVPQELVALVGEEAAPGIWEHMRKAVPDKESIKQEVLAEVTKQQQEVQQRTQQWESWVNSQVSELEDEGKRFNKNELFKVMDEYRPTDNNGNLDFRKGYELWEKLNGNKKSETKEARKKVAAQTTSSPNAQEPATEEFMTPQTLKNKSFRSLIN